MLQVRKIITSWAVCFSVLCCASSTFAVSDPDSGPRSKTNLRAMSGGETTVFAQGRTAFSLPSANMPMLRKLDFSVGNSFFRNPWVIAPATTDVRDGLGALFNTNGCQNCHIRDGRGHAPANLADNAVSLLVRLSIPGPDGNSWPEPVYGGQFQDFAIPGVQPEGRVQIKYQYFNETLADGTQVEMRRPRLSLEELGYGELHSQTQMSARIATPMIGLGLLEAIEAKKIQALADPNDRNQDGISGRANMVLDRATGETVLGRFGWKAGQPSVRQQNAAAFAGDLGVTSTLFPDENCTETQTDCMKAPTGGSPELTEEILDAVTFYAKNLAVPARRNVNDPQVLKGEGVFNDIGCQSCHTPSWTTGIDQQMPWLSEQKIQPFTDLLLHDMGEGLADDHSEFKANGNEWRTPPLWGIGLTQAVNAEFGFMHDGRARNLSEAILWHGGEALDSQREFKQLTTEKREALLAFLESL